MLALSDSVWPGVLSLLEHSSRVYASEVFTVHWLMAPFQPLTGACADRPSFSLPDANCHGQRHLSQLNLLLEVSMLGGTEATQKRQASSSVCLVEATGP